MHPFCGWFVYTVLAGTLGRLYVIEKLDEPGDEATKS